jgi:MarR family transcriptional regulator, organic hydroperoxide resistance regulator
MPRGNKGSLGDVLGFMKSLWAVDHTLRTASKRMKTDIGVTGPQRLAIRMVGRFPGIDAGDLAGLLHIHPSTLTGILSRLEGRGYINRTTDPEDGRRYLFHLTPKGKTMDAARSQTVEARVKRALTRIPASRVKVAREVLESLAAELEKS